MRLSRAQLGLVYVSGSFGFGFQQMAAFLLPLRARELNAPLDQIGLIVGAGAIVPALLSVWSGELADRFGARRTYIGGTIVAAITGLLLFPVTNYWLLLPIQLVMGFARSTAWVASQTYVANIGAPEERATHMGRLSFTTNGGTVVAPLVIGEVANLIGYQASFLFMGGVTLLYTVMGLLMPEVRVPRTTEKRGKGGGFEAAVHLTRQRGVQVVLLLTFVRLWNGSGWRPFIPIFLREAGFDNTLISSVLAANSVVSTFTSLGASWLARRSSNEVATAIALGLGALGTAMTPWVAFVPAVYLPALLIGTGVGVSLPLLMATVSSEVAADQRGVALGMRMSMNQAAGTLAPVSVGAVAEPFGIAAALLVSAVFSLAVLGASMGLYATRDRTMAPPGERV
ncbi:MAG TPA: MFS transporter [Chloroflexota bacterium]|nr:MFS transporter [Chloroflexota bacterium]